MQARGRRLGQYRNLHWSLYHDVQGGVFWNLGTMCASDGGVHAGAPAAGLDVH